MCVQSVLLGILNLAASFQTELGTDTRESGIGMDHSVRAICHPTTQNAYHHLGSNQVSDTDFYRVCVLCHHSISLGEFPPPAPKACFGRDEVIENVATLAENLEPIALIGAGGIGKTSIALTVLHHAQIKERFGENRRFIRCDQFPASSANFLARLSQVIGAGVENPEDLTPLRPFLSSNEVLIILDNAESILCLQGTNAEEISSVVDELSQFKTICLLITSRVATVPSRCKRPEIPTLSMDAASDIFYSIYSDGGRSSTINNLLQRVDFHPLSITILAATVSQNAWDYDRLAEEWDTKQKQTLGIYDSENLSVAIELSLGSPTFHGLDPNVRDLLAVIAFFPQGIDEKNLDWLFTTISNRKNIFDKFCALSVTHRSNGFITMLAPIREYFSPRDPRSSPLLCATKDCYFSRLSVDVDPDKPSFGETQWILLEDMNVEHLLDVFTSIDPDRDDIWDAFYHFIEHLYWHRPRKTVLGPKIRALLDYYHSNLDLLYLSELSLLFGRARDHPRRKQLLTHTLGFEKREGDKQQVIQTLTY